MCSITGVLQYCIFFFLSPFGLTSGVSSSTLQAMWYGGDGLDQPALVQLRLTEPEVKHDRFSASDFRLCRSGLCLIFGLLILAILTHGMDDDTSVTCVVFEGGEKGRTWAVHSFPNLCARPADNSLPEWLTTFVGKEKGGFRLTSELPTSWM